MMGRIVLCADSESLRRPELMGLDGENLEALPWLECFASAEEARLFARESQGLDEAWIVSSDDVEAINVAAAIREDDADLDVYLVLFESSGSVLSRAQAAGVTGTLAKQGLAQRFALEKRKHARHAAADAGARACAVAGGSFGYVSDARGGAKAGGLAEGSLFAAGPSSAAGSSPRLALERTGPASAAAQHDAFVLAVVSGSGGAGKSSVAALAAYLASERGLRTLLLDGDLQFGDLHHLTGLAPAATLDELISREGAAERLGADADGGLVLAGAPQRLEQADVVARELPALLGELRRGFDVIVVNTGASWADHHVVLLEQSTRTLFLVDQRASSVRACQHALELCARCGIATGSFVFALNRCGKGASFTSIDVSCALQGAHVVELAEGGHVVEELLGAGYPSELVAAANPFCASVDRLLDELLPEGAAASGRSRRARGAEHARRERRGGVLSRRLRRHPRRGGAEAPEAFSANASADEEVRA